MQALKDFLNRETIVKCFIFALIVSLLFTWRLTHIKSISFFSTETFKIYSFFTVANFLVFIALFFVLFLLARRRQEPEDERA